MYRLAFLVPILVLLVGITLPAYGQTALPLGRTVVVFSEQWQYSWYREPAVLFGVQEAIFKNRLGRVFTLPRPMTWGEIARYYPELLDPANAERLDTVLEIAISRIQERRAQHLGNVRIGPLYGSASMTSVRAHLSLRILRFWPGYRIPEMIGSASAEGNAEGLVFTSVSMGYGPNYYQYSQQGLDAAAFQDAARKIFQSLNILTPLQPPYIPDPAPTTPEKDP
jgi:hypothetical protein